MKKVLNVFISQPMNGRIEDILNERKGVIQVLGIVNPYKKTWEIHVIDHYPDYAEKDVPDYVEELREPGLWYLGERIKSMADADFVVAIGTNWWQTPGCLVEKNAAEAYDIPIVYNSIENLDYLKHSLRVAMRAKNNIAYKK